MIVSLLSFSLCPWVATTARLDGSAHAGRWAIREYARLCTSIQACPSPFEPARWATSNVTTVLASYSLSLCQPELVSVASPFLFPSIAHDRIPALVFSLSMGCNDGSFGW
eukprot:Gb_19175 [translate_table: standard]